MCGAVLFAKGDPILIFRKTTNAGGVTRVDFTELVRDRPVFLITLVRETKTIVGTTIKERVRGAEEASLSPLGTSGHPLCLTVRGFGG